MSFFLCSYNKGPFGREDDLAFRGWHLKKSMGHYSPVLVPLRHRTPPEITRLELLVDTVFYSLNLVLLICKLRTVGRLAYTQRKKVSRLGEGLSINTMCGLNKSLPGNPSPWVVLEVHVLGLTWG